MSFIVDRGAHPCIDYRAQNVIILRIELLSFNKSSVKRQNKCILMLTTKIEHFIFLVFKLWTTATIQYDSSACGKLREPCFIVGLG